jgi:hypothetical protein
MVRAIVLTEYLLLLKRHKLTCFVFVFCLCVCFILLLVLMCIWFFGC